MRCCVAHGRRRDREASRRPSRRRCAPREPRARARALRFSRATSMRAAHLVGELAHLRTLLWRELAHLAEDTGERTLLTRHRDANAVKLGKVGDAADALVRLGLDGLEVVNDRHAFHAPFVRGLAPAFLGESVRQKNRPRSPSCEQGRMSLRGTTLLGRRMSFPAYPLFSPSRGADGSPTCARVDA